jgi:hypothetical protein
LSCAICEERKEKRFCPAVHGRICPQCCGEQREVTLDCPSECPYLQQSREHRNDHGARGQNEDTAAELSDVEINDVELNDVEITEQFLYEREELILGLSFALARSARADRSLNDRDLITAVTALAMSYHTMVNSNIIYQPANTNLAHQAIAREIETMVREFREAEQRQIGHTRLLDSDVLKALAFLLRLGRGRTSGRPKSRAFIDFLFAQFPEKSSALVGPEESASRIVVP